MAIHEIFDGQTLRPLGCLPRTCQPGDRAPVYAAAGGVDVLPRADLPRRTREEIAAEVAAVRRILNQGNVGSCAPNASVGAVERCGDDAGAAPVNLSWGRLYYMVCGGRDAGSMLGDNLEIARDKGIPPVSGGNETDWRSPWTAEEKATAANNRITEFRDCPTVDHIATACAEGHDVVIGILVGGGFNTNSQGVISAGRGGGGHAVLLRRRTLIDIGGVLHGLIVNSWSKTWGWNGCGLLPLDSFLASTPFTDGWAILARNTPPGESAPPA